MAQAQSATANVKRRVTRAKKKVQRTLGARQRRQTMGAMGGISEIGEKIKEILPRARVRGVRRYLRSSDAIIPIAIGALVVGVAAGALAAIFAPRIRNSDLFNNLGNNVQSAAEKLGEVLQQAKQQVLGRSQEQHTPTV